MKFFREQLTSDQYRGEPPERILQGNELNLVNMFISCLFGEGGGQLLQVSDFYRYLPHYSLSDVFKSVVHFGNSQT